MKGNKMSDQMLIPAKYSARLSWAEWLRGWSYVLFEVIFQKYTARRLQDPLPLPSLNDLTCIVTGSTSGLGLEIAMRFAKAGASLIMAVRNPAVAHDLIQTWRNETNEPVTLNVEVIELDFLCLDSVVAFAKMWNQRFKPLNILINNAGIYSIGQPQKFTKHGYENHLQVNHLAPALLTILLLPSLKRPVSSRVVNVNSTLHFLGKINPYDMSMKTQSFTSLRGYSNSKLAQIMFSSMLQMQLPAELNIHVMCVNPGSVRTNVGRDLPIFLQVLYKHCPLFLMNAQQGSRSALYAATNGDIVKYCKGLKADQRTVCAYISHSCEPIDVAAEACNLESAKRVWESTLDMVGLCGDAVEKILLGEAVQCRYGVQLQEED